MPERTIEQIVDDSFQRVGVIEEFIRADDSDDGERRVRIAVSSEEPVDRWFGREVLDHGKGSVDLGFMRSGTAPLLLQHDHDRQIGVIESVTLGKDRKLRALVRLGKGALASEVWGDVKDGIRANISVGYRIRAFEKELNDDGEMTGIRATDWMPYEASFVSVPADTTVGVGRSQSTKKDVKMPDPVIDTEAVAREAAAQAATVATQAAEARAAETAADVAAAATVAAETRATEVSDIMLLGSRHNMSDEAHAHVGSGGSLSDFRGVVLAKLGSDTQLAPSNDIGLNQRETQDFSVLRLIRASVRGASRSDIDAAQFEIEACGSVERRTGDRGNGIALPPEVLRNFITAEQREMLNIPGTGSRVLQAGTDTALIPTDHLASSFIDLLRARSVLMAAGMTTLPGLEGNVDIPRQATAAAVTWISAEHGDSTDSEGTYDTVSLTPKDLSVSVPMSRRMRQQSSPAIEGLVRMDIVSQMALGMDIAGIEGTGAAGQPTGVLNQTGVNTPTSFAGVNPTWAEVVAMETAVADDNALAGSLGYIGRTNMRGALKTTAKDAGSGLFVMPEGNTLNGYAYHVSNQITDGNLYFGNWADLLMGMWSGLDLVFDDATLAAKNGLYIRAFQTADFAVRHGESFAFNNDGV